MNEKNREKAAENESKMPLSIKNYKLMLIGFAIIVLGFVLMLGGGGTSAEFFNEEMFSFHRITLAPIVVLAGFVFEVFAIMKNYKK